MKILPPILVTVLIGALSYSVSAQTEPLFPIQQAEKFGFINNKGRVAIQPIFDEAGKFHEGYAKIRIGTKWGFIDTRGKIVIAPLFETVQDFSEGLAAVRINDKHGYITSRGEFVITPEYEETWPFSQGLGLAKKNGKYGYLDKTGAVAIEFRFENAGDFVEGRGLVGIAGKHGYVDQSGKVAIDLQFQQAGGFSEGLARVLVNDKVGYIDRAGKMVIEPRFDSAAPFSEGLAVVQLNGKWGYINRKGEIIIKPQFSQAGQFAQGLAPVSVGSHGGYINASGQMVIESPWFDMGAEFSNGLALMQTSDGLAYLDKRGNYVWREKITPLPEIINQIRREKLSKAQIENSKLFPEFDDLDDMLDRFAKSRRGQVITVAKAVLLPSSGSLPNMVGFVNDLTCDADAVIEAEVTSAVPLFTHKRTFLFTDYRFGVQQILKNNVRVPIRKSQNVPVIRSGGQLTIAGRTIQAQIGTTVYPKAGERYLLFLRYIPSTRSYRAWVNGMFRLEGDSFLKLSSNQLWAAADDVSVFEFTRMVRELFQTGCPGKLTTRLADQ